MRMKITIHRMLAIKKERYSCAGKNLPMIHMTIKVMTISIDLSSHIFWRYLSIFHNRCVFFSASRKNFSATNNKKVPQNPAIRTCEAVRISAYLLGSKIARLRAVSGFIFPTIATITNGKSILMPNTAIAIPRVKNLCCRFGSIFFNIFAFTIALSNDKETSNIHKMITINIACNPLVICNALPAQIKNAIPMAMIVKMIEPLKFFI